MKIFDVALLSFAYVEVSILCLLGSTLLTVGTYFAVSLYANASEVATHVSILNEWVILFPTQMIIMSLILQLPLISIQSDWSNYLVQIISYCNTITIMLGTFAYTLLYISLNVLQAQYSEDPAPYPCINNNNNTECSLSERAIYDLFFMGIGGTEYSSSFNHSLGIPHIIYNTSDPRYMQYIIATAVLAYLCILVIAALHLLYSATQLNILRRNIFTPCNITALAILIGPGLQVCVEDIYTKCGSVYTEKVTWICVFLFLSCTVFSISSVFENLGNLSYTAHIITATMCQIIMPLLTTLVPLAVIFLITGFRNMPHNYTACFLSALAFVLKVGDLLVSHPLSRSTTAVDTTTAPLNSALPPDQQNGENLKDKVQPQSAFAFDNGKNNSSTTKLTAQHWFAPAVFNDPYRNEKHIPPLLTRTDEELKKFW
jgi:hypothetical protein